MWRNILLYIIFLYGNAWWIHWQRSWLMNALSRYDCHYAYPKQKMRIIAKTHTKKKPTTGSNCVCRTRSKSLNNFENLFVTCVCFGTFSGILRYTYQRWCSLPVTSIPFTCFSDNLVFRDNNRFQHILLSDIFKILLFLI